MRRSRSLRVAVALRALESAGHDVVGTRPPLPPTDELVAVRTAAWNLGASGIPLADPDRGEPHDRALRDAGRSAAYLWTDRRPPGARRLRFRADRRPSAPPSAS
jgi:hypothetical protein